MAKHHRTIKSGGGIESNQVKSKHEATREKPKVHRVPPGGVDQLGAKVATKSAYEPIHEGRGYKASEFGNVLAERGKAGPGSNRTIHPSGSQSLHGEEVRSDRPQGRDILSSYGPDYRGKSRR